MLARCVSPVPAAHCLAPRVACPPLPDTGPLYVKYNLLLRSKSGVDIFVKRCEASAYGYDDGADAAACPRDEATIGWG